MRYTIKTMNRQDLNIAIDWAANEGWNPGLSDADCYFAADPGGFFMGCLDGEPIAAISAVKYGPSFGFIGFYLVKPGYRGKGYGFRIWQAALEYLQGRCIGLDGVVAQQDNYKKSGFKLAYRNIRFQGQGGGLVPENQNIVALPNLPFETVEAFEQAFFPENRAGFLRAWINQPAARALGILQGDRLAGYGVIRPCRVGYKIGPLYANQPELAENLFLALKAGTKPSDSVFLDVPEVNPAAVALATRFDMALSFETARMYTATPPQLPLPRIFGVTSFEIG